MKVMTCKNCLAPINPHLDHCEYCGGYFEKHPGAYIVKFDMEFDQVEECKKAMERQLKHSKYGILTPNEMRSAIGLVKI